MKKKIILSVSLLVIVGAVGGGYFFSHKKSHSGKASVTSDFQTLAEIKKAQGLTLNTHLDSPTGKAWKAKDFKSLETFFGLKKSVKENHSFFQASIFVLDVTKPDFKPEDREALQRLQNTIVDYMIAKREKPVLGEEAQVLSYASKVLLKFDSMPDSAIQKMLSYYAAANSPNQKDIVGETLVRLNPLPEKARKIVHERLHSKAGPYDGVLLLGQMRDAKAAADFWNEVYKSYANYPAKFKPIVFKQMVINHQIIKGDLKKHLPELAKQASPESEDAFLVGVRELDSLPEFKNDVQRIANKSESPESKMLALSILNSPVGTR